MSDAIKATISIMESEKSEIKIRSSYNVSGISFSPKEITQEIQKSIPDFKISYAPDYRQEIANSWPQSIDDEYANKEWNWKPDINLNKLSNIMLNNLKLILKS